MSGTLQYRVCVRRLSLFWPVCVCDRYLGRLGRVLVLIFTPLSVCLAPPAWLEHSRALELRQSSFNEPVLCRFYEF